MPAYKYKTSKGKVKWYAAFYYVDWTGKRRHSTKRGFDTQREAKEYEKSFLDLQKTSSTILFGSLVENYLEDMGHRLKPTTMENKRYSIEKHILPYFKDQRLCDIDAIRIRKWQNHLMSYRDENGDGYSQTYLKTLNNQMSAIMNYAVKNYGLAANPCHAAGSMGKSKAGIMKFWTVEEYQRFSAQVNKEAVKVAFDILFYTGMRQGEMLALTPADILPSHMVRICKSFAVVRGEQLILIPKTDRSNRTIPMPDFLYDEIMEYISHIYGIKDDERLFYFTKSMLEHNLPTYAKAAGLEPIRVHDLRHSHASMLINAGFDPLTVRDRLGHESVKTTLDTYGHLYPEKNEQLSDFLNGLREINDAIDENGGQEEELKELFYNLKIISKKLEDRLNPL